MTVSTDEVMTMREQFVPKAYGVSHPIILDHADGAYVTDESGRRYIDFAGGIGVLNVGHRAPEVVQAVREQIERLFHSGPVTANRPSIELARRLALRVGLPGDWQTLLVNSGAEAVENAVKLARHATGRSAVIAFEASFHGRTLLTATLTGKTRPHRTQPGAMAPEIYHAPYPNTARPPVGVARDQVVEHTLGTLDRILDTRVALDHVAAVIVEPVQGEGGVVVPPASFLPALASWCRERNILLIADEVQTGYGRTGRFFAFEHTATAPDIITVGKSIGAGLPLAGVIARRELWDLVTAGDIGGTYASNPVASAAGLAVLDLFEDGALLDRSAAIGDRLRRRVGRLADNPYVYDIRGLGGMSAVEFVDDPDTKIPGTTVVAAIVRAARERGLIVIPAGLYGQCVRLFPPLTADDELIDEGAGVFVDAVEAATNETTRVTVAV
jgi:4-aminobutyrate aminotransferase / (S)-3-amino-2-methylpropionate transaminase / 5-aminovalerate transaminase